MIEEENNSMGARKLTLDERNKIIDKIEKKGPNDDTNITIYQISPEFLYTDVPMSKIDFFSVFNKSISTKTQDDIFIDILNQDKVNVEDREKSKKLFIPVS